MPDPITALVAGGSQLIGGMMASDAAGDAAGMQVAASEAGIAEQRRQFDLMQRLLKPYTEAGVGSLAQQQALLGLSGAAPQQAAIQGLQTSPQFQALMQQGENAMLQNAAATGGLRGGNLQAAMAQFRPQLLSKLIDQQYNRLGGITSLGQNSAAGTGNAGMQTGANIANLLGQQGAALAGGELGQAKAWQGLTNLPMTVLGMQYGAGGNMGLGFGDMFSDRRLKTNITKIGTRPDGLSVYAFDYIWGGGRQIGLMADEVQAVYPEAVSEVGGYLAVNYGKV